MQIAVLGPLAVRDDGGATVELAGARVQSLLTRLALAGGRSVPTSVLVDAVWGDTPPIEQGNALQTLVSRLRRVLGPTSVTAGGGGYRLAIEPDDVDALRFARLAGVGSATLRGGDPAAALPLLCEALGLWRGAALADVSLAGETFAAEGARLEDLRLATVVDRWDAELAAGGETDLPELEALAEQYLLNERLAALRIRALAASGRPADALAAYERLRARLADELGVDPSAELQQLHLSLLQGGVEPAAEVRSVRRTNLKAQLTSFVGREADVKRIVATLGEHRLVTLVGPGGAGKTRLSAEAAAQLLGDVPGGVWFAELAPVTAEIDVAQAVLEAAGLREAVLVDRRPVSARDALTRLVDGLAGRTTLLVLDNCEHLIEATAALADQLLAHCPGLRVLATSREPLAIVGEAVLPVPPLGQPEADAPAEVAMSYPAVQLFAERAAAVRPGFTVDAGTVATVIDIVRRLDGLPLAIELAAARLRTLPLAEVSARLSDRFRLLTGGSRTALPRHRTLRAVVEWSWDLLTPAERLLVEQLAVFPSGITVDSAAAVAQTTRDDVADELASLVDKSLLQRVGDGRRLRMLETIREYGAERLAERSELGPVRARHAAHFATLMAEAERHLLQADQLPWFDLLRAERDNLVAALRHLCDIGEADRALRLAVSLAFYGMMIGLSEEIAGWVAQALAVPGGVDEDLRILAEAVRVMGLAGAAQRTDDIDSSLARMRELAVQLDRLPAELSPWLYVLRIGATYFAEDRALCERYLREAAESDDRWTRAVGFMFRAMLAENDGDVAVMREANARAFAEFTELGERWGLGAALRNLGQLATLDGDLDAAADAYQQGLALAAQLHSRDDEGWMLSRLADVEMRRGDYPAARRCVGRALAAAERGGSPFEATFSLAMLAGVEQLSGDLDSAREHQRMAHAQMREFPIDHPAVGHIRAVVLSVSLRMASADGQLAQARVLAREAADTALETRDMPLVAGVAVAYADLLERGGDPERAARVLGASDVLRGAADPTAVDVVMISARLCASLGEERFHASYAAGAGLDKDGARALLQDL